MSLKKIRNNISKSGQSMYDKRDLICHGFHVNWNHWKEAHTWDITTNPFPIHRRLTNDHICLTSASKMRNYLAEDVLDAEMLNLMLNYQNSLSNENALNLSGTVALLQQTSVLISVFRDSRPIHQPSDERLQKLKEVVNWFDSWEVSNMKSEKIRSKEKSLISHQTRQDILSCIYGFLDYCSTRLSLQHTSIIASRFNSDVIENVFCQQRGLHNGNNTNPTYLQYCSTMNTIIMGQTSVSRKSNTGGKNADPLSFSVRAPRPKKMKTNQH